MLISSTRLAGFVRWLKPGQTNNKEEEGGCEACRSLPNQEVESPSVTKATKSLPAIGVSVLVAFFPKCPVCWAAYMSMFGSFGLAQLPYQGWLYPVLLTFLGVHLFFIYRKVKTKGYGPFLISLVGATVLIATRLFTINSEAVLYLGMLCILGGSLWNSFEFSFRKTPSLTH